MNLPSYKFHELIIDTVNISLLFLIAFILSIYRFYIVSNIGI